MTKLEEIALRKYRIDLTKEREPDQQSVTYRVTPQSIIPVAAAKASRQAEYDRLKAELQRAKNNLQQFVDSDRQERRLERQRSRLVH